MLLMPPDCSSADTASIEPDAKRPREDLHPFGFPFPPYDLQVNFMKALYQCLEEGGVGVFESPTGTGKSLSLICGALKWLVDQQGKAEREILAAAGAAAAAEGEPAWVGEQAREAELVKARKGASALVEARAKREARLNKYLAGTERAATSVLAARRFKPVSAAAIAKAEAMFDGDGSEFALAEWAGDAEDDGVTSAGKPAEAGSHGAGGPRDAFALGRRRSALELSDSDDDAEVVDDDDDAYAYKPFTIFYCSRTHSQLAQVVGEVRKTAYGDRVSLVSLAGRKQLCQNESVRGLGASDRVNEACLELQVHGSKAKKKKTKKGSATSGADVDAEASGTEAEGKGCPYHQPGSEEQRHARQSVSDRLLNAPLDVEELAVLGTKEGCCAYYATRSALPEAQLVLLPYASLLHAGTRETLGISLKRSVIIVDEAHNLIDTINDTHSVTVSARNLSEISAQLAQYAERYQNRLKPVNRHCVNQLLYVVRALRTALLPQASTQQPSPKTSQPGHAENARLPAAAGAGVEAGGSAPSERIVRMNAFLHSLNIDHINLYRLRTFCEGSQIARKLRGFSDSQAAEAMAVGGGSGGGAGGRASLHGVLGVLEALTNIDADARVLVHVERPGGAPVPAASPNRPVGPPTGGVAADLSFLRVLHLNPAVSFSKVLAQAHAVVLAGGTMQPFVDLEMQLFRNLPPGRCRTHCFGHIVPAANLLPLVVSQGPSGVPLNFNFASRATPPLMDELAKLLAALCDAVPDGVVVFVPSFGYEEQLVAHWEKTGAWAKLAARKRLFREPREACDLDAVLKGYAQTIEDNHQGKGTAGPRGALLLSVVGGKMSEGINFADGLGRCVVMVGMPFANPSEITLCERMAHLDASQGPGSGREYYTNACMKAVNQSVGRAIRHIADYATIILADGRFAKPAVRRRLPQWIGDRLQTPPSFAEAHQRVHGFFARRTGQQREIEERRERCVT